MTDPVAGDARELVGQQLGPYQIEAPLAIGGQSGLFRARDLYTDNLVALKLLPATLSTSRDAVTRLREEMRRVARLRHPHLLPVVEVSVERGLLYAVALLPVASLRDRFERDGLLAPSDAVRYAAELAWALNAIHSAGLVHGDVQPANMFFDIHGGLRLTDFGVARALAAIPRQQGKERRSSGPSRPLATRSYMAPELAQGGEITPRSDIYSLGAVFYEMLTGTLPLVAPDGTLAGDEITTAPLPPSMRSSEDWPELAAVALKALTPDPARRYPDARSFAVALRSAVFTQQREDQRPSLIAALSGVFHAPGDGGEATFIQRITGAPVPSAPFVPGAGHAGPLDVRHIAYRTTPASPSPSEPLPAPVPPAAAPPAASPSVPPAVPLLSEDEIATSLLNERLLDRHAAYLPAPQVPIPEVWNDDEGTTTLLDRRHIEREVERSELPSIGVPLPPPSIPPRHDEAFAGDDDEIDVTAAWLAALDRTAATPPEHAAQPLEAVGGEDPASAADALTPPDGPAPLPPDELVEDLRRLARGSSKVFGAGQQRANPGWVKALLATLGVTVLVAVSALGILASSHAPNAAHGGPDIPTATSIPANTVSVATPAATLPATRSSDSHGSIFAFPTPTPILPTPTLAPQTIP